MIQNEKKDQEDQWLDMTYKEKKQKSPLTKRRQKKQTKLDVLFEISLSLQPYVRTC